MTNYNERLDKILMGVWHTGYNRCNVEKNHPDGYDNYKFAIEPKQAKQAITSLTKELVAEAKPRKKNLLTATLKSDGKNRDRALRYSGYNHAINHFEQNLLKGLEEK